jgi:hypothetical protein
MAKTKVETGNEEARGPMGTDTNVQWSHASATIWNPAIGDVMIGLYDGKALVPDSVKSHMKDDAMKREIWQHFFLIDVNGVRRRYSLIGGQIFDSTIENNPEIKPGTLMRVEFLGQRETKGGNRANEFDVQYHNA